METNKNIVDFTKPRKRESIDISYFENLASQAILHSKKPVSKVIKPVFNKKILWLSSVAAIFIIIFFSKGLIETDSNNVEVSNSEILAFVDENIDEFDQDLITNYISTIETDTLKNKTISKEIKTENIQIEFENLEDLFEGVNSEDVLNYLEIESISIEELEDPNNI